MIDKTVLDEYLKYDPDTGVFTWKVPVKGTRGRGNEAGTTTSKGYKDVCLKGKKYGLHRLAFIALGLPVPAYVDHINGIKNDNRWCNLRAATSRDNSFNQTGRATKSGYKNVYYDKRGRKKWFCVIFDSSGRKHRSEFFLTPEEANTCAITMRERLQGAFFKHA